MNGLELGEAIQARLNAVIPSRPVFLNAVPDGTLPTRYLVVWTSEGTEEASRSCGTTSIQSPDVWVTSVSRNADAQRAAHEAAWASAQVRRALRDWRPVGGWKIRPVMSVPPQRDETLPVSTVRSVEQFRLRSYIGASA